MSSSPFYTPRLLLRQPEPADAAAIRWLCDDPRLARTLPDLSHLSTLAAARTWIASLPLATTSGSVRSFLIERRERPEIVGAISLLFGAEPDHAEVTLWIGAFHWRHGYAGEALRAILYHAFLQLRLSAISGWCLRNNTASSRLMQRNGFRQDATEAGIRAVGDGRIFNCHRLASSAWRSVHLHETC